MLLRLLVFAMLALGLGGFGTVAFLSTRHPAKVQVAQAAPPPPIQHMILAAATPLRAGTLLKPGDLRTVAVTSVPAGGQDDSAANRSSLVGAMIRRSLEANAPLLAADILRPGDHGFLAAVLEPGECAASVGVDAVSGNAGLIWPGDHVDLILTQELQTPGLAENHHVAGETILSDVRVIAIDELLARGVAPAEQAAGLQRTVTLEVTPDQARRIAVATRLGRLSLAVRAAEQTAASARPVPVQTVWAGDVSPALDHARAAPRQGAVLHLYNGTAEGKEFRF